MYQGRYGHFSTDRNWQFWTWTQAWFFIFFFYVRAQFVAERRCTCSVTLANLWMKCLQCVKLESESSPMTTCNIRNMTTMTGAAFNTTHLMQHIKNKHSKNTCSLESTGEDTEAANTCGYFQKEREFILRGSGFSWSPGVFESLVCPTISA